MEYGSNLLLIFTIVGSTLRRQLLLTERGARTARLVLICRMYLADGQQKVSFPHPASLGWMVSAVSRLSRTVTLTRSQSFRNGSVPARPIRPTLRKVLRES
jgi:hypothetical protein